MDLAIILAMKKKEARISVARAEPFTTGGALRGVMPHSFSYRLIVAIVVRKHIRDHSCGKHTEQLLWRAIHFNTIH